MLLSALNSAATEAASSGRAARTRTRGGVRAARP